MQGDRQPDDRTGFGGLFADVPWFKVLFGAGTVIGGIALAVMNYERPAPALRAAPPVLGAATETELAQKLKELDRELRPRVEALEHYMATHEVFVQQRSPELARMIDDLRRDLNRAMDSIEKNGDRLDELAYERLRRKP